MHPDSKSFTLTADNGLLRELITDCGISLANVPGTLVHPVNGFKALWDTGATNTVITQEVVDKCGLKPTGMVMVHGVNSETLSETYLVDVYLPNKVAIQGVNVTKGALKNAQILIGMDIITSGDFTISNKGGRTIFSFRVPSESQTDYVKHWEEYLKNENKKNWRAGRKPIGRR